MKKTKGYMRRILAALLSIILVAVNTPIKVYAAEEKLVVELTPSVSEYSEENTEITIKVSATGESLAPKSLLLGDEEVTGAVPSEVIDNSYTYTYTSEQPLAVGEYTFTVKALVDDVEETKEAIFTVTEPVVAEPEITLEIEPDGNEYNAEPTSISITVTGQNVPDGESVEDIKIYLDNAAEPLALGEPSVDLEKHEYIYTYTSSEALVTGEYKFKATAAIGEKTVASGEVTYTVSSAKATIEGSEWKKGLYLKEYYMYTLTNDKGLDGTYAAQVKEGDAVTVMVSDEETNVFKITGAKVGEATIEFTFTPEGDTNYANYEASTLEKVVEVTKIPLTVTWTGLEKEYDGEASFTTDSLPTIAEGVDGDFDSLPAAKLNAVEGNFEFTLVAADSGKQEAELTTALSLTDAAAEIYELPTKPITTTITVTPIQLTAENISDAVGSNKNYDATSDAKFEAGNEPKLVAQEDAEKDTVLKQELDNLKLSYTAKYYNTIDTLDVEEAGNSEKDTSAGKIKLTDLKVLNAADGTESINYIFKDDITKDITNQEAKFTIYANGDFFEFTGIDKGDFGSEKVTGENESKVATYWFNAVNNTIDKAGFTFGTSMTGDFSVSYTIENNTVLYAKNTEGEISKKINVAYDATAPMGGIYAAIGKEDAVSITGLINTFDTIQNNKEIKVVMVGSDTESNIKTVEWYGTNEAWENDTDLSEGDFLAGKWAGLIEDTTVIDVNAQEENSNVELQVIKSEEEIKRFYYAKVTDYAGNVTYISSSGVLQDNTVPVVDVLLEEAKKTYTNEGSNEAFNVYTSTDDNGDVNVGFTVKLQETGITSGISDVEVTLQRTMAKDENKLADDSKTYDIDTTEFWTEDSTAIVTAIADLKGTDKPTEEQINAVSTSGSNTLDISGTLKGLEDGNYYILRVVAKDKAGNKSAEKTVRFIVDTQKPVVVYEKDDSSNLTGMSFNDERLEDTAYYTGGTVTATVTDMTLVTEDTKLLSGATVTSISQVVAENGLTTKTITLEFGAEKANTEGTYELAITAKDALDNTPEAEETTKESFIVDYTKPTYSVEFSEVDEHADTVENTKKYYNSDIIAVFEFTEETTYDESLIQFVVENNAQTAVIDWAGNEAAVSTGDYTITKDSTNSKKFTLSVKADDVTHSTDDDGYRFSVIGKDKAGNSLAAAAEEDETALDVIRAMDTTIPVLTKIEYDTIDKFVTHTKDNTAFDYVNADTKITFTLTEHNPMDSKATLTSEAEPLTNAWNAATNADEYTTSIDVTQLGEYGDIQTVTLLTYDKAGNAAIIENNNILRSADNTTYGDGKFTDKFIVDKVAPQITYEYLVYNPDNVNVDSVDYFKQEITVKATLIEHNFYKELITAEVQVDAAAGIVAEISEGWTQDSANADKYEKTFTYKNDGQYNLTIKGVDAANNQLDLAVVPDGQITSTEETLTDNSVVTGVKTALDKTLPATGDTAKPVVVVTPSGPSGTTTDGIPLYAQSITYDVVVYDPMTNDFCSGIEAITITARAENVNTITSTISKDGTITAGSGMTISLESDNKGLLAKGKDNQYVYRVTLDEAVFNANGIVLSAEATDISKNKANATANTTAIDVKNPMAIISYNTDDVHNGRYFNEDRIVTIQVQERNFSNDCIDFVVNGNRIELSFSRINEGSGNRDDAIWQADYTFGGDDDYTVSCSVRDRAGNVGIATFTGEVPQEFTIDKTAPVISIAYNNNNALNGRYFDEARTAVIEINEHNFNGAEVVVVGTALDNGTAITYPAISSWSRSGDVNRATITYTADAAYTLNVTYADLATNAANTLETAEFTIDNTNPTIEITGVEDGEAYADTVAPIINFNDKNYDSYEITLTRSERESLNVDVSESFIPTPRIGINANGYGTGTFTFEDIEHISANDGIYTLNITVYDRAGRSTTESITYSVNRFGSVYIYSDDLRDAVGKYHQELEGELYVSVFNATPLVEDSTKIEITRDGSVLSNQLSTADITAVQRNGENGWYEYTFVIDKNDFVKDGSYEIKISDMDIAGNTRTNGDEPIKFYMDKTAPVLDSVVGLEKEIVNAEEQIVNYVISDAIGLSSIMVYLNDVCIEQITSFDNETNYEGSFRITEGFRQKVRFVVVDKAENVFDSTSEQFAPGFSYTDDITVSTNVFIRWYANAPFFWGSIGVGGASVTAAALWLVLKKRRTALLKTE